MKTELWVDPRARMVFASYYLKGWMDLHGQDSFKFRMRPFRDLDHIGDPDHAFDHYMGLVLKKNGKEHRIIIDYRDKDTINQRAAEWCDVYGKINLNSGHTEKEVLNKSVALGPMIGINIWNRPRTLYHYFMNYRMSKKYLEVSRRYFLAGYTWQLRRPPMEEYGPAESEDKYIFFDSQLWTEENDAEATNAWRASFIRTCKGMEDLTFEGGLFGSKDHPDYEKYKDLMLNEFITTDEYVRRIKRSTLVFNTPSCHHGHGWKLGEFLALGKAMVSTPIFNDLPVPLEHGKNVHFVESEEQIRDAVKQITSDPSYRKKLEKGARDYHETYMAPAKVMQRLLGDL